MPSHGACWARARRRPGADPMRALVSRNRDFSRATGGPLPKRRPPPRRARFAGTRGPLGHRIGPCGCGEEEVRGGPCRAGLAGPNPGGGLQDRAPAPAELSHPTRSPCPAVCLPKGALPGAAWPGCLASRPEKAAAGLKASSGVQSGGAGTAPAAAILQVWLATRLGRGRGVRVGRRGAGSGAQRLQGRVRDAARARARRQGCSWPGSRSKMG